MSFPSKPPFYVVSDTHFFHDNIVKFCNRREEIAKLSGWEHPYVYGDKRLQEIDHNEYMIERWNAVVGPDDVILHLGDLCLWRGDGMIMMENRIAPRLNGQKYLIMGNHDKGSKSQYMRMGFTVIEPFAMKYKGYDVMFQHYPFEGVLQPEDKLVYVHGHIHNNGYPKENGPQGWKAGTNPSMPMQANMSVEEIDYTPQPIEQVLRRFIR